MCSLTWHRDGSEGIKWSLRGLGDDGSSYGEIRFPSPHADRRKASTVSRRLPTAEVKRLGAFIRRIRSELPPGEAGRHFGALFKRPTDGLSRDARRLFEYYCSDEVHSNASRAFVELVGLPDRHLPPSYRRLAEHLVAADWLRGPLNLGGRHCQWRKS